MLLASLGLFVVNATIITTRWLERTGGRKNRNATNDNNNDEDEREKRERGRRDERREAKAPVCLQVEQIETKVQHHKTGERWRGPGGGKKRGEKMDERPERSRAVGQSRRRDDRGGVVRTLGAILSCFVLTNREIAMIRVRSFRGPNCAMCSRGVSTIVQLCSVAKNVIVFCRTANGCEYVYYVMNKWI